MLNAILSMLSFHVLAALTLLTAAAFQACREMLRRVADASAQRWKKLSSTGLFARISSRVSPLSSCGNTSHSSVART